MLDKNSISKAIDNLRLPMAIMVVAILVTSLTR